MVDLHTHIMFDIDDGAMNKSESKRMLMEASKLGFNYVVLTPHYIKESNYNANNMQKNEKFIELKQYVKDEGLNLQLFMGNEAYITDDLDELIKSKEVYTLNNSRYLLVEFPLNDKINNSPEIMFNLRVKEYVPIIAHPERCAIFQDNYELITEMKNQGVLFQINILSLIGYYGKTAQKLATKLVKENKAVTLSSDAHRDGEHYVLWPKAYTKLCKIVGITKARELLYSNPIKILKNESIN